MKKRNLFALLGVFAIVGTIVMFSSFDNAKNEKQLLLIERYYDAGDWVVSNPNPPGVTCGAAQGQACFGSYDNTGVTRTPDDILNDALTEYAALGYFSDGLTSQTVQVDATTGSNPPQVSVTITEKAP